MNAHKATILNGITLVLMSVWSYFATQSPSVFVSTAFGVVFLLLAPGIKRESSLIAHIAVVLVVVYILALFNPLRGTIERGNVAGTIRVGLMMLTSVVALVYYVKSFIDARRARS